MTSLKSTNSPFSSEPSLDFDTIKRQPRLVHFLVECIREQGKDTQRNLEEANDLSGICDKISPTSRFYLRQLLVEYLEMLTVTKKYVSVQPIFDNMLLRMQYLSPEWNTFKDEELIAHLVLDTPRTTPFDHDFNAPAAFIKQKKEVPTTEPADKDRGTKRPRTDTVENQQ